MHLADMRAPSVGAGPRFDSGTTPRLRYPTRWPSIRRRRAKYWYCTDSQTAYVVSGPTYGEILPTWKAYRRQIARLWHTTDAYEAHNHRQRDKYWPTADASSFERRRRPFYESVTTPMVSERQHIGTLSDLHRRCMTKIAAPSSNNTAAAPAPPRPLLCQSRERARAIRRAT